MSALAAVDPFEDRLPDTDEIRSAGEAHDLLAPVAARGAVTLTIDANGADETVRLAPAVARTLVEVLRHFRNGKAVTLVPVGATLTTQQAADMLNVSRPHLVKLIDEGRLPATKVGRHRRLDANVVFAFKQARDEQRSGALDELIGDSADLL